MTEDGRHPASHYGYAVARKTEDSGTIAKAGKAGKEEREGDPEDGRRRTDYSKSCWGRETEDKIFYSFKRVASCS
jgi:hypothetical protein